jgi:hypothetical protein
MIALARFVMAGSSQAALVAAVAAILSLILPPLAWISGGVIALVVLHLGPQRGAQLIAFSGLATMFFGWIAVGTPMLAFGIMMLLWMPVWSAAAVLRSTVSLGLSLQLITALGVVFVLVLQFGFPELQTELSKEFDKLIQPMVEKQQTSATKEELNAAVDLVLPLMPGLLAMGMMIGSVISLLLGRWWQATLYNPGGFAKEFNALRLGKVLAGITTVVLLVSFLTDAELVTMLALVLLGIYLIQGLALMHGVIEYKQINKVWLFGLYFMIFFLPHLVVIPLSVFGLTDAWIDFRRRLMN